MRILSVMLAIAASAALSASAAVPEGWTDDFDAAAGRAATNGKRLLVDFSGSDWCGWCKKLDKEVFAKKEFVQKAAEKFELVLVDSPRNKSILSEKAAARNPELVKKYKVNGYPTVLVMDAEGKVLYRTGYREGGPEAYLKHLDAVLSMLATKERLEKELASLKKGSAERVKKIDAAMSKLSSEAQEECGGYISELLANDPDGKYAKKYPYFSVVKPLKGKLGTIFRDMNSDFRRKCKALGHEPSEDEIKTIRSEVEAAATSRLVEFKNELGEAKAKVPASSQKEIEKLVKSVESILEDK